jgi:superfamily II DNA or RNA helicase
MSSYEQFLKLKSIPKYGWDGHAAVIPDEYASLFHTDAPVIHKSDYVPSDFLFDYQRDIAAMAIQKQKFSVFAECGLGKTLILMEMAKHTHRIGNKTLIVSPLMVVDQTLGEAAKFYPSLPIEQVRSANLQQWLDAPVTAKTPIGITNYESIRDDLSIGNAGALLLDESSLLKSAYGSWGTRLIEMGRCLHWKACFTGTPAPNDQIEYANHSIFMNHKKTVNEFLASYFINRGQTSERWELKRHAVSKFYRDLSHWCIFLNNPATYGWKDNCSTIPPIHVHIEQIELTDEQRKLSQKLTGNIFAGNIGGIGMRGKLSQISKGKGGISTNKPQFIRNLVDSWPEESTIIWCHYNDEQKIMERTFPEAASITGDTPIEDRMRLIADFKAGRVKQLITKAKILGFGQNLQIATRQVFSGISDSYEMYWQAVKRSNRIGSKLPLNVHIPVTELEEPMVQNVLRKAKRIQRDTEEQEKLFREKRFQFS